MSTLKAYLRFFFGFQISQQSNATSQKKLTEEL